jgi:hypothetical protein
MPSKSGSERCLDHEPGRRRGTGGVRGVGLDDEGRRQAEAAREVAELLR